MAGRKRLSLEEVLEGVLASEEDFNELDSSEDEWSEEEPCERESFLFCNNTNVSQMQDFEPEIGRVFSGTPRCPP